MKVLHSHNKQHHTDTIALKVSLELPHFRISLMAKTYGYNHIAQHVEQHHGIILPKSSYFSGHTLEFYPQTKTKG